MSAKSVSPTAAALRSSRLFSLPTPIARESSHKPGRISNTATQAYPTQQAITTPPKSLARGDWGLKRSLPLRSTTKTSTPVVKVHAVDTREHITDFDSASDLSRTLAKFKELRAPVLVNTSHGVHRSAFEPDHDNTDPDIPAKNPETNAEITRWRHEGVPLETMSEGEFNVYLDKVLRDKKPAFLALVRRRLLQKKQQDETSEQRHSGAKSVSRASSTEVSDEEVNEYLRVLRASNQAFSTSSELASLVNEILDLPSGGMSAVEAAMKMMRTPPQMHPSGGLGYLKTDAILLNDAIFGPRARPAPQPARFLQAKKGSTFEVLGVSGFVSQATQQGTDVHSQQKAYKLDDVLAGATTEEQQNRIRHDHASKSVGLAIPGGNRVWVEPQYATLDSAGCTHLVVSQASPSNVGPHTGQPGETHERELGSHISGDNTMYRRMSAAALARRPTRQETVHNNYGLQNQYDDGAGDLLEGQRAKSA